MDPHDRSFVDPNDEHPSNYIQFDNLEEDTNTNPIGNHYQLAESEIMIPNSHLLKTIMEEAEELLGTVVIPFRNEVKGTVFSKEEKKAR